jgi:hypothetical protein
MLVKYEINSVDLCEYVLDWVRILPHCKEINARFCRPDDCTPPVRVNIKLTPVFTDAYIPVTSCWAEYTENNVAYKVNRTGEIYLAAYLNRSITPIVDNYLRGRRQRYVNEPLCHGN